MKTSLLCITLLAFASTTATAQLAANSNAPIDITGDTAEFKEQEAEWTGNVRVVQEEAILTTKRLLARLDEEGGFESITAIGDVRYSNGKEAITGERGVYLEDERTITISENVVVTQGKQVLTAGRVIYWVDTGKVRFIPKEGNRIRGIFYTNADDQS